MLLVFKIEVFNMKDFIEEEISVIDRLYENDKMEMLKN